jgi:hypothetical protein
MQAPSLTTDTTVTIPAHSKLPAEIWRPIFSFATRLTCPIYHDSICLFQYHSPFWPPEVEYAWMVSLRTRKSLVTVCRMWREWSTEYLYTEIRLRHCESIKHLAKVLQLSAKVKREAGRSHGWWVREIYVHCLDPHLISEDENNVEPALDAYIATGSILAYCDNLVSFVFQSLPEGMYNVVSGASSFGLTSGIIMSPSCETIEHLALQQIALVDGALTQIADFCTGLKTLTIARLSPSEPLTFNTLKHLTLIVPPKDETFNRLSIPASWKLPNIESLTIIMWCTTVAKFDVSIKPLLQSCGHQLRGLELLRHHEEKSPNSEMGVLAPLAVAMCPNLSYLGYTLPIANIELTSPTVREVGLSIFSDTYRAADRDVWIELDLLEQSFFPQLEKIRFLDVVDLPMILFNDLERNRDIWKERLDMCAMAGVRVEDFRGESLTLPDEDEWWSELDSEGSSYVLSTTEESEDYSTDDGIDVG